MVIEGWMVWPLWPLVVGTIAAVEVRRGRSRWYLVGVLALATYSIWVASVTFFPMFVDVGYGAGGEWARWSTEVNLVPFYSLTDSFEYLDAPRLLRMHGGNLLLLAPYTILGPLLWPRLRGWRKALALGFGISVGIELAQWSLRVLVRPPYRSMDIDDVILNVAGAMLGYGIYALGRRWGERRAARADVTESAVA